jgi:4-amino-4-deoxy-L-arabinose transferase-like glycosyltransferase
MPSGESSGMPAQPGWLRSDLRETPSPVWCALALHLLLLLVYTTLQPAFRGLDEPAHVDMAVHLPDLSHWPGPGEKLLDDRTVAAAAQAGYYEPPPRPVPGRRGVAKDDRPSFDEVGPSRRGPSVNQMIQHPPLYYAVLAGGLELIPGSQRWPYDRQVALLRYLSLLMVFPLPLLCWLAARRLGLSRSAGVVASFFPLAVPGLTRVGASVSNDALLILLVATASVLALAVAAGDLRRRTAVALGLVTAGALLTKGLSLAMVVVVAMAYGAAALAGARRNAVASALLSLVLAVGLGGWWYLRNLLEYDAVQPNGYPGGGLPYPERAGDGLAAWLPTYVESMFFRFWSALGSPEPPQLPYRLCIGLSVAVVLLSVAAFVVGRGRRLALAVALLPLGGLLALVALGSYGNYQTYGRFIGVQGRYLYPALAGLAAVVAFALTRLAGRFSPYVVPLVLVGAGAMQLLAVRAIVTTYWTPAGDPSDEVAGYRALAAASSLSDAAVTGLWGLAVIAAVATGLATAWSTRQELKVRSAAAGVA